jgi:nucleoside phosphorylase
MSIGVMFALRIEAKPFLKLLEGHEVRPDGLHTGRIGGHDVTIAFSGMGPERSTSSALALLSSEKISVLISAGTAGALRDCLNSGDGVICKTIIDASSAPYSTYATDPALLSKIGEVSGVNVGCTLISVSKIIASPYEKCELGKKFDATVVDMESASGARVARAFGIPFLSIRAIVDCVDDCLPATLSDLMRPDGSIRASAIPSTVISHPSTIVDGIRIHKQSAIATKNLAQILSKCIPPLAD